jgi:branched-chain amino acid transport system ATP-binding protein
VFLKTPPRTRARTRKDETAAVTGNGSAAALVAAGITKRYGGIDAVHDVSFTLHQDEILGIIGPNGAGKTSLFDVMTGFQAPDEGTLCVTDGVNVAAWSAHRRAAAGFGRSFQDARLWPSLTVHEALSVACERWIAAPDALSAVFGLRSVRDSETVVVARADELIELLGLQAFADKFVGELSTGSRRIVEIGTLLAHRPQLVLLDEPSAGIAQRETEALGPLLRDVRQQLACSMIVIEHDMALITALADRLLAMVSGQVVVVGDAAHVLSHPDVVEAYLGTATPV